MAQNQTNDNSKGVFKKMYNATIGRIFNRQRHSQAPVRTAEIPPEPSPILIKPARNIVHHPSETKKHPPGSERHKNKNNNVTIFSPNSPSDDSSQEIVVSHGHVVRDEGKKFELSKTNKMFSDYIAKVHGEMEAESNVESVTKRSVTKRDSFNDMVSDYINRVKSKIRRTTSVDDDKGASFK